MPVVLWKWVVGGGYIPRHVSLLNFLYIYHEFSIVGPPLRFTSVYRERIPKENRQQTDENAP